MELQSERGRSRSLSSVSAQDALSSLNVDPAVGLSSTEAATRLALHGPNSARAALDLSHPQP